MPRLLPLLAALILLALPSQATAQTQETNAPPGNSAIDEYLETVPNDRGNARPRAPGGNQSNSALTKQQRARLERLGPDGKTLADAVEATAPTTHGSPKNAEPPAGSGRSPLREVLDAAAG